MRKTTKPYISGPHRPKPGDIYTHGAENYSGLHPKK